MKNLFLKFTLVAILLGNCSWVNAQIFTKVTTPTNPIVADPAQNYYNGASWIDYDNDNLLDLFIIRSGLYHNDGNGNFSKIINSGLGLAGGIGNSWADVDNDGDLDCVQSGGGSVGTKLFLNNGNGTFTQSLTGALATPTSLRGWGSAFGDYNNDGWVDLFIASPYNFVAITDSCKFLVNMGNGIFTRVDTTIVTDTLDAFTVPSWSDYDQDGDVDLFIGSGRVNGALSRDYLFDNNHVAGGGPLFSRMNTAPMGTDLHDGQVWNWIDFDNDGDLDGYLTNYGGTTPAVGYPNEMYRNDSNIFVKLTVAEVGPIVTDTGISLSNTWGDFDNDGDLDCIVTNEGPQNNAYYQNNVMQGSTVFTKITNEPMVLNSGNHWCATSGDYDNDGDLDVYISGASDKGLFENTTTLTDFINIKLVGLTSNMSGIGAKVKVKAKGFWQMREISAQNTFNGMNMLNAHFGFGISGSTPLLIDTIRIEWPSGIVDLCTNIPSNVMYTATEGQCLSVTALHSFENSNVDDFLLTVYPNPVDEHLTFSYTLSQPENMQIELLDIHSKSVHPKIVMNGTIGNNTASLDIKDLAPGIYTLYISNGKNSATKKFVKYQ
ncbi:MAG: VCBS repeat-containing protein [Bacteroidetes bacterium]|nr:VCBS repeat-containing protein [Bacteroidota bacterium]